jgi:hypothetical protein
MQYGYNNVWAGTNQFNARINAFSLVFLFSDLSCNNVKLNGTITANSLSITAVQIGYLSTLTSDVQTQINTKTTLSGIQSNNNTWTGTNVFNTLPTSSLTPSSSTQLITKAYGDSLITNLLSGSNSWSGSNSFNGNLPTSTITPSTSVHLVTKTYPAGLLTYLYANNNIFTGINTFNTNLPISTLTPTTETQLITKTYGDSLITNLLANSNAYTGINTFNTNLLTSTLTPTTGIQLLNKTYVDTTLYTQYGYNNIWTGTNQFNTRINAFGLLYCYNDLSCNNVKLNGTITANALSITATQIGYLSTLTSDVQTQLNATSGSVQSNNNVWTGTNSFNTSLVV